MENYFEKLNSINVNEHTEKKLNLTYLSWAWALSEVKKIYPEADYLALKDDIGNAYFLSGTGAEVRGYAYLTLEERDWFLSLNKEDRLLIAKSLPIMDNKNKSIPVESIDSMNVNTAHQRNLAKAFAYKGLGLYIYAGEDLPEAEAKQLATKDQIEIICKLYDLENIEKIIGYYKVKSLDELTVEQASEVIKNKNAKKK